jgi:hypothetical protein
MIFLIAFFGRITYLDVCLGYSFFGSSSFAKDNGKKFLLMGTENRWKKSKRKKNTMN